jgi:hypothetical protein
VLEFQKVDRQGSRNRHVEAHLVRPCGSDGGASPRLLRRCCWCWRRGPAMRACSAQQRRARNRLAKPFVGWWEISLDTAASAGHVGSDGPESTMGTT